MEQHLIIVRFVTMLLKPPKFVGVGHHALNPFFVGNTRVLRLEIIAFYDAFYVYAQVRQSDASAPIPTQIWRQVLFVVLYF